MKVAVVTGGAKGIGLAIAQIIKDLTFPSFDANIEQRR